MDYKLECPSFDAYMKEHKKQGTVSDMRAGALSFAHPVDAGIISVLDNPAVNKVFSSMVDLSVNAQYGLILSTGIRVDQKDPEISEILGHCCGILKMRVPYTVISSSVNGVNAMAIGTDEFNFIAVGSLMKAMMEKKEMLFVLGHECGHIALGHVVYHTVLNTVRSFAELIPFLGPAVYQVSSWPLKAWSRRSEISADRAGLLCCGDIETACHTLLKLEAGFMDVEDINVDDYISDTNEGLKKASLGKYQELLAGHPILAKRMEALRVFSRSEKFYRLSGKKLPEGVRMFDDQELENKTEEIVKVL